MGYGWTETIHPDDVEPLMGVWTRSVTTGRTFTFEYRIRSKTGEYRFMLARAVPLMNRVTGTVDKWFGTC